jgi:hypothetical protein
LVGSSSARSLVSGSVVGVVFVEDFGSFLTCGSDE